MCGAAAVAALASYAAPASAATAAKASSAAAAVAPAAVLSASSAVCQSDLEISLPAWLSHRRRLEASPYAGLAMTDVATLADFAGGRGSSAARSPNIGQSASLTFALILNAPCSSKGASQSIIDADDGAAWQVQPQTATSLTDAHDDAGSLRVAAPVQAQLSPAVFTPAEALAFPATAEAPVSSPLPTDVSTIGARPATAASTLGGGQQTASLAATAFAAAPASAGWPGAALGASSSGLSAPPAATGAAVSDAPSPAEPILAPPTPPAEAASVAAPLPEPSTWVLMLFGIGAAGAMLRRQARPALAPIRVDARPSARRR
ncbi:PEPxxWA-CTERM sorting domain-containing protein [Phenylobacterium sp.]|uniref:PEPxxWA-CTERM sorting domain-containing protein n=1 Tax=Phenylobacterium sp. TaxID=1871053 RepID=UPI001209908A|nr:PEPxxWA-CTERM sorting domain-containing protein [Phenylobacterium sp.]THD62727.1 MAG: PEP-CTERM sorting domain-containing protein [Phenylobacterium sp.]